MRRISSLSLLLISSRSNKSRQQVVAAFTTGVAKLNRNNETLEFHKKKLGGVRFHNSNQYNIHKNSPVEEDTAVVMEESASSPPVPLGNLAKHVDLSWIHHLNPEKNHEAFLKEPSQNQRKRPVKNGHYVLVQPKPLKEPRLVLYSADMAKRLRLDETLDVGSQEFLNFFSGNVPESPLKDVTKTWATPYALSIMGTRYTNNCPFGTGDGYGDGRAISIGEVKFRNEDHTTFDRYEMQLKGAGPTPFCRGADGRAVLRSSIREFLASEAMHHLGISTTRAISLIVSEGGDYSNRPWYAETLSDGDDNGASSNPFTSGNSRRGPQLPTIDDPRLAMYPLDKRKQIIAQLARQKRDPDVMIQEPNAITCRVAPSFVRIGHIDLFARRASMARDDKGKFDKNSHQYQELKDIIWHAAFREFYDDAYAPFYDKDDLKGCVTVVLRKSCEMIAEMVSEWVRVGFAQGNFNADNCLIAGRTMDYGPFGFMDQYDPSFAKWTGSGEHFAFMRQPTAGIVNFSVLVDSMLQALRIDDDDEEVEKLGDSILKEAQNVFQAKVNNIWTKKLGFLSSNDLPPSLWPELESLLRESDADWTLFWRKLTEVAKEYPIESKDVSTSYSDMMITLEGTEEVNPRSSPFYTPLKEETRKKFLIWIEKWRQSLRNSIANNLEDQQETVYERMRKANPKYVLREWMLVEAYSKAANGDESVLHQLNKLIQSPYDEGSDEDHQKYFLRAPDEALRTGGTAFMS